MTIEEILMKLYEYSRQTRGVPKSRDKGAASLFKAVQRKIGSSRKALFMAGVIPDARAIRYPQLMFTVKNGRYCLDERSREVLRRLSVNDTRRKNRMV